jgi:hypothetical protein
MTRSIVAAVLVVACVVVGSAGITKLSRQDRRVLVDAARFREVGSVTNLPPALVALCADENGRFADRGGKWESTDVIMDPTLPRKRLVWAAVGGEYWVVYYERGGRGHGFHVLVARQEAADGKVKPVWRAVGGPLKDYVAFVGAVVKNQLDDELEYAH